MLKQTLKEKAKNGNKREFFYKKNNSQLKNLFLQQSYLDSWEDYESSINKSSFIRWDYVILTASNETQATTYREQIEFRLKNNQLPLGVHYAVLPDPEGKESGIRWSYI